MSTPRVGVLALQGAFAAHSKHLAGLGADVRYVRVPSDLVGLDGLIIPGGESTTMSMLLDSSGLHRPLNRAVEEGLAIFGTCAGLILCARDIVDGRHDQHALGFVDVTVRRNGYGRQLDSFEAAVDGVEGGPFHAVFIRAPRITCVGPSVQVLAHHGDDPVLIRDGRHLMASFHPELTQDVRIHELFIDGLATSSESDGG